jgi:hypothetical protein
LATTTATSSVTNRGDSISPTIADPAITPRNSLSWLSRSRSTPAAQLPSQDAWSASSANKLPNPAASVSVQVRQYSANGLPSREPTLAGLREAGRAHGNAAVMHHAAVSARRDLSPAEEKTLDRLERKGFARRVRDPRDGRRVNVEADPGAEARFASLFAPSRPGWTSCTPATRTRS